MKMTTMLAMGLMGLTLLVAGCATEGYVNGQVDPLATRVRSLEDKLASTQTKLDQVRDADQGDRAGIKDARDTAYQALDMARKAEADAQKARDDARR